MRSSLIRPAYCVSPATGSRAMNFTWVILFTLVGFFLLAAILLVPIYLFLRREERVSEQWTPHSLEERVEGDRSEKER